MHKSNQKFVLSVYSDAICIKDEEMWLICHRNGGQLLGFSMYSSSIAWRSAARRLRKEMLWKLEQ